MPSTAALAPLVLDTNVVLDLLVFDDPAVAGLRRAIEVGAVAWLATEAMRAELERVLTYSRIAIRLLRESLTRGAVLAHYDRLAQSRTAAPAAAVRCSDRDDQIFIDLAVAYKAVLLSKDLAVLCLSKRLSVLGVRVVRSASWDAGATGCQIGELDSSSCSRKLCALESGQGPVHHDEVGRDTGLQHRLGDGKPLPRMADTLLESGRVSA
jgi:predicted nucleic acid-binding protein